MKNTLKLIIMFLSLSVYTYSQLGGLPGAFSRMGFSARGIAMGNTVTSITKRYL